MCGFAGYIDRSGPTADELGLVVDAMTQTLTHRGDRLRSGGIVDTASVRSAWREHLSGQRNRQYELWDVLMLQAWLGDARPAWAGSIHSAEARSAARVLP